MAFNRTGALIGGDNNSSEFAVAKRLFTLYEVAHFLFFLCIYFLPLIFDDVDLSAGRYIKTMQIRAKLSDYFTNG